MIIEKNNIKHIHCGFLSWPGCVGLAVSKLTKVNFSISAHARDIFIESGAVNLKARNCTFITCCNNYGLEFLKATLNPDFHKKLYLNHHGIDLQTPIPVNKRKTPNLIMAAGRLVKKKGFELLLKAAKDIIQQNPAVNLVIAGNGPEKNNLLEISKELNIQNNVYFVGWLSQNKLMKLMSDSSILIVPSIIDLDGDSDGIPNVILEAFAVGTAVIASSVAGISEAVIDEKTGLLIEPANECQLRNSLIRLLQDNNLSSKLCSNAYNLVKEKFDLTENTRKLATLFMRNVSLLPVEKET